MFGHLAAEVFEFLINLSPTIAISIEDIIYKVIQSIGAAGTFGAFIFIAYQTRLLGRQTETLITQTNLLQHESDINFRPWVRLERKSDSQPIEVSIEPDRNMVTATFRFRNHGKLSTTSAQGVFDIDFKSMTDLGTRDLQLVLPKAFPPDQVITHSEAKDDPDLIQGIFDKRYFYVGLFMKYFYKDKVRNATSTGTYYVLVHVKVEIIDMEAAGKRVGTTTMYIVHESLE